MYKLTIVFNNSYTWSFETVERAEEFARNVGATYYTIEEN